MINLLYIQCSVECSVVLTPVKEWVWGGELMGSNGSAKEGKCLFLGLARVL